PFIPAGFLPAFFMTGAAHNLFVPLALAVGFSMVASYLLSSTFVPILSVWVLRMAGTHGKPRETCEGGEQTAPLGRAVIGGLIGATCATLIVLPAIFATLQSRHARISASLDPDDPSSPYFELGPRLATVSGAGDGRAKRQANAGATRTDVEE